MAAWEQESYTVHEGQGQVELCFMLTGLTERAVEIVVDTTADTAINNFTCKYDTSTSKLNVIIIITSLNGWVLQG